ncbi:MAG: phosphoglucosamine mutase [Actinobacteria bacterium]|uniref:Phosphoglucosamine mutase n=1 Tax=freshwater metagenome TaxID=449393 RepID=A0A6J6PUY7_9ZZZZ|nr:phosphoglucosamine mutase [Actinomycetota bacterium]MSY52270.1 phosphoglucosamine mutase [Actinomycetota bacterium]MSY88051.1 phosphoglucosamine mutase [Actinomycetota bacterium]NBP91716.1 phosphoglucosamine mutase [Actinomycetota bacterium]
MGRLFGTDGVRGVANKDLTAELALDLSVAAAHILAEKGTFAGHRPRAIVGRDTRVSGEFLEAAVVAGLASAGIDVYRVGVLPTPAVAHLVNVTGADLGVMISASHNPMPDNGIKFFAKGGIKLDDALEDAIEARLNEPWERPVGDAVGRIIDDVEAGERYLQHILASVDQRFEGLKIVIDGANGAASSVSPKAFRSLGAEVVEVATTPNGFNINDGVGSTHIDQLAARVLSEKADMGFAHDGDADRCLAVDSAGNIIDGDQIMAILALSMKERGLLAKNTVVATVMSNLGFIRAMKDAGVNVIAAAVGDRYVLEEMRQGSFNLGGEQSGHLILADYAETGDGVLTALHLTAAVTRSGKSLATLASVFTRYPQVLVNVSGVDRTRVAEMGNAVATAERELGENGRVLLRPSGTEPVVRVMVEAAEVEVAQRVAHALADEVRATLSL